jgi:hypothetical protein
MLKDQTSTLIDTFTFFDNFTAADDPDYLTGEITSFFGFCLSGGQGSQRVAPETETQYQQQGQNLTK